MSAWNLIRDIRVNLAHIAESGALGIAWIFPVQLVWTSYNEIGLVEYTPSRHYFADTAQAARVVVYFVSVFIT